ncbi:putative membrane protein [Neomicrococcus aestuarii]|uniref:Putative membrane protein n=1 Tax=Neomicrococcus aestuarii TaxID=556325 RepID=A0A7W8WZA0_9MICC|nr:vitamin K epoxide reductase family protein [Neomicrococcus aestuarii]MBB5512062.1 putative membrane protein [Neomicrococcus aestuarii]
MNRPADPTPLSAADTYQDRDDDDAALSAAYPALPAWASNRGFGWIVALTGLVAFIASFILVLERFALYKDPGHVTSCDINPWISCGTVMRSWQAALFGFPNPIIGIIGFAVVITIGVSLLSGARFPRWYWIGFQTGITLAFAFCVWLWSQAVYDINALCIYCMIVWAMMIILFITTFSRNILTDVIPSSDGLKRFVASWNWMFVALLVIAVAASIFFRFMNAFFPAS